jgi:3-hydroxyacyl-CoA dehydrogenase
MGGGIAMTCANAGIAVTLTDVNGALLERARKTIADNYASSVKKGKLSQAEMDARLARISYAGSLEEAVRDAELVIEAVFEEMALKQDVFGRIDRAAPAGAVLATNTSTLDVDAIASVTARPQDVVGLHFFSPANVMRLLEIVRGARTSEATLAHALTIAKQLKKVAVVAGNGDGFIGNRMLYAYRREAEFLLEEGATPEQVDAAVRAFGLAMGPFAMADLAGLDVGWRIRKRRYAEHPPKGRVSRIADTLCEMGRFGLKTGAGWYRYEPGSRVPLPDPLVHEIIERASREAGIERRAISDDEIVRRCFYPLVQEGYKILDEGIAARPGDIDAVYVYGYGWPAWRGGPMHWAETIGLRQGELSWT